MTPQQMMDLPGYQSGQRAAIKQGNWDYDYPQWFLGRVSEITGIELSEHQKTDLIDVLGEQMEGYQ